MANLWTLHVQNFAKIKQASITVSPFMMFVGENNTGKSYIMVLLWGIIAKAQSLIEHHLNKHPDYTTIRDELAEQIAPLMKQPENPILPIGEDTQAKLLQMFNDILAEQKEDLVKELFNHRMEIGTLRIERESYFDLALGRDDERVGVPVRNNALSVLKDSTPVGIRIGWVHDTDNDFIRWAVADHMMATILQMLIQHDYLDDVAQSFFDVPLLPLYLPASRTGFMHTYRAIIGNNSSLGASKTSPVFFEPVENIRRKPIPGTRLNLPTTEFLNRLLTRSPDEEQQEEFQEELHFLSRQILHGSIENDDVAQITFKPDDSEASLPLHVTSSLVAELSPIALFLASDYNPKLWIIEELEAHLHPKMQIAVARLMFRLVNKGKAIWLTTHSENLTQQFNNLLTLSQRDYKEQIMEKLGYSPSDLLSDLSIVSAYQFETDDKGYTQIAKLELGTYGFVLATFNDTLDKLIRETDIIQNYPEVRE